MRNKIFSEISISDELHLYNASISDALHLDTKIPPIIFLVLVFVFVLVFVLVFEIDAFHLHTKIPPVILLASPVKIKALLSLNGLRYQ